MAHLGKFLHSVLFLSFPVVLTYGVINIGYAHDYMLYMFAAVTLTVYFFLACYLRVVMSNSSRLPFLISGLVTAVLISAFSSRGNMVALLSMGFTFIVWAKVVSSANKPFQDFMPSP